jgi:hypothetical protein
MAHLVRPTLNPRGCGGLRWRLHLPYPTPYIKRGALSLIHPLGFRLLSFTCGSQVLERSYGVRSLHHTHAIMLLEFRFGSMFFLGFVGPEPMGRLYTVHV